MSSLVALSSSMNQKKATAAQIENVRRQWEELDYQSKVALSLHFTDNQEKLEESMASQSSRDSPSRPTQAKETQKKNKAKKVNKAKTSLPSAPPKGHLEELAEAPTTKDQEPPAATQRLAEGMTSTPTKRPRVADSSKEEDGFTTVQRKKKRGSASPPQARRSTPEPTPRTTPEKPEEKRTRPTRIPPLVIEGPLVDKMASPTELRKVIKIPERISHQDQCWDLPAPLQDRGRPPRSPDPWVEAHQLLHSSFAQQKGPPKNTGPPPSRSS